MKSEERWQYLGDILAAHALMLGSAGLFDEAAVAMIVARISELSEAQPADGSASRMLAEFDARLDALTPQTFATASRIGRATNDVLATLARLESRRVLLAMADQAELLRQVVIEMAGSFAAVIAPLYQTSQAIQVTTIGHLFGPVIAGSRRGTDRLLLALDHIDESPMGALSGVSTGLGIDPARTAALLGFQRNGTNAIDTVSATDWIGEAAAAIGALAVPPQLLLNELSGWLRSEPTAIRWLPSASERRFELPQTSFPAKLIDLADTLAVIGQRAAAVQSIARRTEIGPPFDLTRYSDELVELSEQFAETLAGVTDLLSTSLEINRADIANRASKQRMSSSDVAEFLMIQEQLDPASASAIATAAVDRLNERSAELSALTPELIDAVALQVIGRELGIEIESISRYLAPRRFIERRTHPGGPALPAVEQSLADEEGYLAASRAAFAQISARIAAADAERNRQTAAAVAFNPEA